MRRTKFYQIALTRLAEHLGVEITVHPTKRGWVVCDLSHRMSEKNRGDEWLASGFHWEGGKKLVLALLVMQALGPPPVGWDMTKEEVADVIRLTRVSGRDRGLKGHQWQTLKSVLVEGA